MFRALSNPKLFLTLFGFVERMNHPGGNERIVIAMDKKHGVGAFLDLFDGGRLAKAPAILDLAQ